MLDLNDPFSEPVQLPIAGDYLQQHGAFNPHGLSHWEDQNGDIFVYVISHWPEGEDSVEVFQYFHKTPELVHIKSLRHPLIFQLNNIHAVGRDEFYATNYHSTSWFPLKVLEYAVTCVTIVIK